MARTKSSDTKWLDEVIKRLDQGAEKTEKGLEDIRKELKGLGETAIRQAGALEDHMRRTEANEKAVTLMEQNHEATINKIDERMRPLESHVSMWAGAGKVLAVLGTLAGLIVAIIKVLSLYL